MDIVESTLDQEGILTITLNHPEKLNALNKDILDHLRHLFLKATEQSVIKALLITGNGKAFSAGADISQLAACRAEDGYRFSCAGQAIFKQLAMLNKPALMAINGYAFGGGCELAIAGHIRIATKESQFGQPEVKLGVIPGYGGTQRLARLIGKGRAMDLCLTGRFIDAQTALQWGLITEIVATDQLLERGKEILKGILKMAPLAISSVIEAIEYGYDLPLNEALHLEAIHFAKLCSTQDKEAGVQAFLSKKNPEFHGI